MNIPLIIALTAFSFSPGDSCRTLVTLERIPERAVRFAELAAGNGGEDVIEYGNMLELHGDFPRASTVFRAAMDASDDPDLDRWLMGRINGTSPLDSVILVMVTVMNPGPCAVENVIIEIPLPVSHPPYQEIKIAGGAFTAAGETMRSAVTRIGPGTGVSLPLIIEVRQEPHTHRPVDTACLGNRGACGIAEIIRSIEAVDRPGAPGPCLALAKALRDTACRRGIEATVVGGLLRTGSDSLLFHAWNLLGTESLPVDPTLFPEDSLRGMFHSPTDIIPLWNLEKTGLHEVTAYYRQPEVELVLSMKASFIAPDVSEAFLELLSVIPVPGWSRFDRRKYGESTSGFFLKNPR